MNENKKFSLDDETLGKVVNGERVVKDPKGYLKETFNSGAVGINIDGLVEKMSQRGIELDEVTLKSLIDVANRANEDIRETSEMKSASTASEDNSKAEFYLSLITALRQKISETQGKNPLDSRLEGMRGTLNHLVQLAKTETNRGQDFFDVNTKVKSREQREEPLQ